MKKLMIALAAVAMAAGVQAAQWTWKISASDYVTTPGSTAGLSSGTAYIFADLTEGQFKSIVSDFAAGTYAASGYETTATFASGGVFNGSVTEDSDSRVQNQNVTWSTVVLATIDDQSYLYISNPVDAARGADGKNKTVTFKEYATSFAAAKDASAGYAGAGWYTATVPEPTSGLLLLLGVAGLALRRRRA